MDLSKLAGAPHCNEKLPVGDPEEIYLFHQFMPIVQDDNGTTLQVAIPLEVAYPQLVQWVKAQPKGDGPDPLPLLKHGITPFVPKWKRIAIDPVVVPRDVYLQDVTKVLATGRFEDSGKKYNLGGREEVTERLSAGMPVVTKLPSNKNSKGEMLRLIPAVSSIGAMPDHVQLESADIAHFMAGKTLLLPGTGAVKVDISKEDGGRLLQHGVATVRARVGDLTRDIVVETVSHTALARVIGPQDRAMASALRTEYSRKPWMNERVYTTPDPSDAPPLNPAFVVYVPILQRWKSLGYERGALLNTFSLAPREEVTVEVFTWDRTKTSTETTTSFESQRTSEASFERKLTDTVVDTASHSWGWQFGANAGFQVPQIKLNVNANFSIDNRNQTSQQHTVETINDGTIKVATMLKSSLQTKVTEAREFGTEERTTRKFQNPNLGRILHFDCFEVLHWYDVSTEYDFKHARLCVLVPFADFLQALVAPETKSRAAGLLALEGLLFDSVPDRLRAGFDAARQFMAWDRICQYSCDSGCECAKPPDTSTPAQNADTNPWEEDLTKAMTRIRPPIEQLRAATGHLLESALGPYPGGKAWKNCTADERAERESDWHRFLFRRLVLERQLSGFWGDCVAFYNLRDDADFLDKVDSFETMKDRLIPSVADFLSPIFAATSIPMTMMDTLINGMGEFSTWVIGDMIKEAGFDDAGLQMATVRAIELYDKWRKFEDDQKPKPAAQDQPPIPQPQDAKPPRRSDAEEYSAEALAAASVSIDALVNFLLLNRSAYRAFIFNTLNPVDRERYLGLLGDVGKYLQTTVLGFVGDSIAVEVDPQKQDAFDKWLKDHLHKWDAPKAKPVPVALPVPGMTMQTRIEHCDALEPYLTKSREIELKRLAAIAAQQEYEAARLKTRLEKDLLDDPDPDLPVIKVQNVSPDTPK